jgi:hypothetical protein
MQISLNLVIYSNYSTNTAFPKSDRLDLAGRRETLLATAASIILYWLDYRDDNKFPHRYLKLALYLVKRLVELESGDAATLPEIIGEPSRVAGIPAGQ